MQRAQRATSDGRDKKVRGEIGQKSNLVIKLSVLFLGARSII